MKKILLVLFACLLAGCKFETSSSSPAVSNVASQGNDESKSTETVSNYESEDSSSNRYSFSTRDDLSMDEENIVISQTSNNTSTVHNWVLGQNYKTLTGTGFEVDIKINENMNYAAVRMNKKPGSYDDIQFKIYSNGSFKISQTGKNTLLSLSAADSKIDISKYNRIKARTCDSGKVEVYVNGYLVKTFETSDLAFTLVDTDKFGIAYNVKSSTSADNPAKAWIKTRSLQKKK